MLDYLFQSESTLMYYIIGIYLSLLILPFGVLCYLAATNFFSAVGSIVDGRAKERLLKRKPRVILGGSIDYNLFPEVDSAKSVRIITKDNEIKKFKNRYYSLK